MSARAFFTLFLHRPTLSRIHPTVFTSQNLFAGIPTRSFSAGVNLANGYKATTQRLLTPSVSSLLFMEHARIGHREISFFLIPKPTSQSFRAEHLHISRLLASRARPESRNKTAIFYIFSVVVSLVGLSYAAVPLYQKFCQVLICLSIN